MLLPRVITAIIMAVLLLLLLFFVELNFFIAIMLVLCAIFAFEWSNVSGVSHLFARLTYIVLSLCILVLLLHGVDLLSELSFMVNVLDAMPDSVSRLNIDQIKLFNLNGITWAFIFLWVISYPASTSFWKSSVVRLILGWLILLPFFVAIIALRAKSQGAEILLYLLLLVAAADVGAYFTGKAIGRRKLLIHVSPGKTWEGFLGGLVVASVIAMGAWHAGFNFNLAHGEFLVLALIASLMGVLGDLFESMLKRYRGIKDSSNLLPGHGGFLDRVDSHLAAIPMFYLLLMLLSV